MAEPKLVWASYGKRSGWAHWGKNSALSLVVPGDEFATKAVRIAAAAEGGKIDAVQCYDTGIMSAGPLQGTARFGLLQRLLARMQRLDFPRFESYFGEIMYERSWVAVWGSTEAFDARGKFAFYSLDDPTTPLKSMAELERILLGGSDGRKWSRQQSGYAKAWMYPFVRILQDPVFLPCVANESAWIVQRYLHPKAKPILDRIEPTPGLLRATYLSFAINHPAGALRLLRETVKEYDDRPHLLPPTPENITASMLQGCRMRDMEGNPHRLPNTFPARANSLRKPLEAEFGFWQPS